MKIKKIILEKWIDPALITHHLTKKFGDKGLAWLDSDGKENGEWSIIGIKPKKIIQSRDINNLDKTNNPFNNLKNIEKGFWIQNPFSIFFKLLNGLLVLSKLLISLDWIIFLGLIPIIDHSPFSLPSLSSQANPLSPNFFVR